MLSNERACHNVLVRARVLRGQLSSRMNRYCWAVPFVVIVCNAAQNELISAAQPDDAEQRIEVMTCPDPIVVNVDTPSTRETFEVTVTRTVSPELKEFFEDRAFEWWPDEEQQPLRSITGDQSYSLGIEQRTASRSVTDADVVVGPSRMRVRAGEAVSLRFNISRPRTLRPGVYEGRLLSNLRHFEVPGVIIQYSWPVVLTVRGRTISKVRFCDDAGNLGKVEVGMSSSVRFRVEIVGHDTLGEGRLVLTDPTSPTGDNLLLDIPLPLQAPSHLRNFADDDLIETTIDLNDLQIGRADRFANTMCKKPQCRVSEWTDYIISTQTPSLPTETKYSKYHPESAVQIFDVNVGLPECFRIGHLRAEVWWQQDAAGRSAEQVTAKADVKVESGMFVSPRTPLKHEPVHIHVTSESDLGATIPVIVSGPSGAEELVLNRSRSRFGPFDYHAVYMPASGYHSFGRYEVFLDSDKGNEQQKHALITGRKFDVFFDCRIAVGNRLPILVFRVSEPFHYHWVGYKPRDAKAGKVTRKNAFVMKYNSDSITRLSIELRGLAYERDNERKWLDKVSELKKHPDFSLIASTDASDGQSVETLLEIAEKHDGRFSYFLRWDVLSAEGSATDRSVREGETTPQTQNADDYFKFDMAVAIQERNEKLGQLKPRTSRFPVCEVNYSLRLLLEAYDQASQQQIYRVVKVPCLVKVEEATPYYLHDFGTVGGALAVLIAIGLFWLSSKRKERQRSKRTAED